MKNTVEISNDNVCVYYDASIKPDTFLIVVLTLINLFLLLLFIIIIASTYDAGLPKLSLFVIYVVLPTIYLLTVGRVCLWNLFGKEHLVINTKSIAKKVSFGFFQSQWNLININNPTYEIVINERYSGQEYGTLRFIHYDENDLPIEVFSTTVVLPIERLLTLVSELDYVYNIARAEQTGDIFYNPN